jgi:hypothetical protein
LNVKFEYTGSNTPQRYSLTEVAFHTIANRERAILNATNIPRKLRFILWQEAFQTATILDGLDVINIEGKPNTWYGKWDGKVPKFFKDLRVWGEDGAVKLRTRSDTKFDDQGFVCIM